jgi:hypothetical protein
MSSAVRSIAIAKTNVTNVGTVNTIAYDDNDDVEDSNFLPVPFTVSDGVLDIAVQDNVLVRILTPGQITGDSDIGDGFSNEPKIQASVMGGLSPVSSLGSNMVIFLKNFIAAYTNDDAADYNLVTNIEIYNAPTMTKVRFNSIGQDDAWDFSNTAPVKTTPNPVSGNSSNNYRVVWIFKSPLVISYKFDNSDTRYLTFTSALDSD